MNLPLCYGIVSLWAILSLAFLIVCVICYRHSNEELKRVQLVTKTWFYIIAVFSSFFFLPKFFVFFLFCLELLSLAEVWGAYRRIAKKSISKLIWFVGLFAWVCFVLFCAYDVYTYSLPAFFFIIVLTQLNDVFQYLWGKGIGGRLILPKISPAKTWAGFLGGVFSSGVLAFLIAPYFIETGRIQAFGVGVIIAVLGFWGDITVSFFKRQCAIKDFGTVLPGHGGILDRIDSLLYVLPATMLFLVLL